MKVEIYPKEINALDELLKDAKVPVAMGYVLGALRLRIQVEYNKEQESQLKEKFDGKTKGKAK